jgi:hypothetical protein
MARLQKMSSYSLSTPRNIASSTSPKTFFKGAKNTDYESTGPFVCLNHHLSEFVQVVFSMPRKDKMFSHCLSTPWNISTSTSQKSFFKELQKADYESTEQFAYLNHYLGEFFKAAFFDAQEAQNDLGRLFDTLKLRFIVF